MGCVGLNLKFSKVCKLQQSPIKLKRKAVMHFLNTTLDVYIYPINAIYLFIRVDVCLHSNANIYIYIYPSTYTF